MALFQASLYLLFLSKLNLIVSVVCVAGEPSGDNKYRSIENLTLGTNVSLSFAQNELRHELDKLERRPRWTPPSSYSRLYSSNALDSSNYGFNQMQHLLRNFRQTTASARDNSVSINNLISWKSSTEQRLLRLEQLLQSSTHNIGQITLSEERNAHQQDRIRQNSRDIVKIKTQITRLQESVQRLISRNTISKKFDADFERAVANTASVSRQRNDVDTHSRQIASLQQSLHRLQSQVQVESSSNELPSRRRTNSMTQNENRNFSISAFNDDVSRILNEHEAKLAKHDVTLRRKSIDITSLQHQLFRELDRGDERDLQIASLQEILFNASSRSMRFTGHGRARPKTLLELNQVVNDHEEEIKLLQDQRGDDQTCCRRVGFLNNQLNRVESKVNQVRNRLDESASSVRLQKQVTDELTNRMVTHRVMITRTQTLIAGNRKSIRRTGQNLQDRFNLMSSELNNTVEREIERNAERIRHLFESQLTSLQIIFNNNSQAAEDSDRNSRLRELEIDHNKLKTLFEIALPRLVASMVLNNTLIWNRLESINQSIEHSTTQLRSMQNIIHRRENTIESFRNSNQPSIKRLEDMLINIARSIRLELTTQQDSLQEELRYLNSSYHHLRATVQRQSDRNAVKSSDIQQLRQDGRNLNENVEHLNERFLEHVLNANNKTTTLRRLILSDAASVQRIVGQRLDQIELAVTSFNLTIEDRLHRYRDLSQQFLERNSEFQQKIEEFRKEESSFYSNMENLRRRQSRFENETLSNLRSLNASLLQSIEDRFIEKNVSLEGALELTNKNIQVLSENVSALYDRSSLHRRFTFRLKRLLFGVRHLTDRTSYRTNVLEKKVNKSITAIRERNNAVALKLQRHDDDIKANRIDIRVERKRIGQEVKALQRLHNVTREVVKDVKFRLNGTLRGFYSHLEDNNNRLTRMGDHVSHLSEENLREKQQYQSRLAALETLNTTFQVEIQNCIDNYEELLDSIELLRHSHVIFSGSIERHERALLEHRNLHENMTVVSDGVNNMISEHSEALDTVRQVVRQLNETVAEKKEEVEETVSAKMQRHVQEIKGLRKIMRNFTRIIEEVLNEKLNQDLTMTSVQLRQRSLIQVLNEQSELIRSVKQDETRLESRLLLTQHVSNNNERQIENARRVLSGHQQQLQSLVSAAYHLTDVTSQLNASLIMQSEELAELDRYTESSRSDIYDLFERLSTQQQEFSSYKNEIEMEINEISSQQTGIVLENEKQNLTFTALNHWSQDAQIAIEQFESNIILLDTRVELIAGALDSLTSIETNITDLRWIVDEVVDDAKKNSESLKNYQNVFASTEKLNFAFLSFQESSSQRQEILENRINQLDRATSNLAPKLHADNLKLNRLEDVLIPSLIAANELTHVLNATLSQQHQVLTSIENELSTDHQKLLRITRKVEQNSGLLTSLQQTDARIQTEIDAVETFYRAISAANAMLSDASSKADESLREVQNLAWNLDSRVEELNSRTNAIEDRVSFFHAKYSGPLDRVQSSVDDITNRITIVESNITSSRTRFELLNSDLIFIQNQTEKLHDVINIQEHSLKEINKSLTFNAMDAFASIASTIASIEDFVHSVNSSLSSDVTNINSLLIDFQLAFDTSGRVMERQYHEFNILFANSTNYFDYFTSTVDYLKQIVHQTSEAVLENRDRVQHLNNTIFFLQLQTPVFLHSSSNEEQNKNLNNNDDDVSPPLPAAMLSQNTFLQQHSSNDYHEENDDEYDDDIYNIEEVRSENTVYSKEFSPETGNSRFAAARQRSTDFAQALLTEPNEYLQANELQYDIAAVLSGEADQVRIQRKMAALMDGSYVEDYDDNNDDYE